MNAFQTSLDLIKFIEVNSIMCHIRSSHLLSLIAYNPEMVEWAASHKKIEKSRIRLLKHKQVMSNANLWLVMDIGKAVRDAEDYFWLSANNHPSAIDMLKKSFHHVWYGMLCKNTSPDAVRIIKHMYLSGFTEDLRICFDPDAPVVSKSEFNFGSLAANPSACEFVVSELSHYLFSDDPEHRKMWIGLSRNPHPQAIALLHKYSDRVDVDSLASNPNKEAIILLMDLVPMCDLNWGNLSANPAAVFVLKENPLRVRYERLAANPHPLAMKVFAKWYACNPNKIALQTMLKQNFRDEYLHQYVDFA